MRLLIAMLHNLYIHQNKLRATPGKVPYRQSLFMFMDKIIKDNQDIVVRFLRRNQRVDVFVKKFASKVSVSNHLKCYLSAKI